MVTAEKTQEKQKQFQVPDYSDEDYDSADDYTDEEDEQPVPNKNKTQQLQRRRQQPQKQDELEEYSDDDDYYSDEYDDEYSDDDMIQGKSMQPYSGQRSKDSDPTGGMNVIDEKKKSIDDEEGMKLKLELNLEIEIELKAHIHGDLTIALM